MRLEGYLWSGPLWAHVVVRNDHERHRLGGETAARGRQGSGAADSKDLRLPLNELA
jgi:hypothetical protein